MRAGSTGRWAATVMGVLLLGALESAGIGQAGRSLGSYRAHLDSLRTGVWLEARRTPKKKSAKKKHNSGGLVDGPEASGETPNSADVQPEADAPRVSRENAVSLRQQLALLRMQKRQEKRDQVRASGGGVGVASKYRKAKDEEAEEALKKEDREAAGYRSYGTQLFVDGLNVINKWPKLKKRLNRGEFALARALLEQDMDGVAAMRGWNVKIVYDGGGETENIASYDTTMPEYGKGSSKAGRGGKRGMAISCSSPCSAH
eukprot:scaffold4_cov247-Pinguiococcus_pyrenoidosus.AAC.6